MKNTSLWTLFIWFHMLPSLYISWWLCYPNNFLLANLTYVRYMNTEHRSLNWAVDSLWCFVAEHVYRHIIHDPVGKVTFYNPKYFAQLEPERTIDPETKITSFCTVRGIFRAVRNSSPPCNLMWQPRVWWCKKSAVAITKEEKGRGLCRAEKKGLFCTLFPPQWLQLSKLAEWVLSLERRSSRYFFSQRLNSSPSA